METWADVSFDSNEGVPGLLEEGEAGSAQPISSQGSPRDLPHAPHPPEWGKLFKGFH